MEVLSFGSVMSYCKLYGFGKPAAMAARWPNICCSAMSQPSGKMSRSEKVKGSLAPVNGRGKLVEDSHAMALKSKSTCGLACKQSFWIMRACNRKTRSPPLKTK